MNMKEYERFIKKYFPAANYKEDLGTLYLYICENNYMTDIYMKYLDRDKEYLSEEKIVFLNRYKIGLNKILIYILINDTIGINACMRYCIEQFLKFTYSIYINKSVNEINKVSYRFLKEELNKTSIDSGELKKLYSYYGKYSNEIHDKQTVLTNEMSYLETILVTPNCFIESVNQDISKILRSYHKIMIDIFQIKEMQLSAAERIGLENLLGRKKKEKIMKLLVQN
nr:hypothetical protein [uncultured Cellulosilyticum sp.]